MRRAVVGTLLTGLAIGAQAASAGTVHAGGFEMSGVGTRGMGRGGAIAARSDDALALALNPAMLADVDSQILLNVHALVWDACVQRDGTYDGGATGDNYTGGGTIFAAGDGAQPSTWAESAFPRVCNSAAPQIVPQVMASVRLSDDLGMAFGIVAPNGSGTAQWGSDSGTVSSNGQLLPTPTRYALTGQDLLLFFPSVGFGYRPFDWLRVGLTLQWGVGIISFTNYTNSGTAASGSTGTFNEDPSSDIRTQLNVVDPFVPAGILSVHVSPTDNFDLMVSGRISDAIGGVADASGTLELTTGAYGTGASGSYVPTTTTIQGATLHAGQPFQFTLAARYADRIRPRAHRRTEAQALAGHIEDGMRNENWDLELDVVYEQLSQVTDFVVTVPGGTSARLVDGDNTSINVPVPTPLPIPHGWSDVVTTRLGGDVNVIPETLALRAGVSFELPVDSRYRQYITQDFIGGWRLGLHAGATVRLGRFDLSAAYGFFLGETVQTQNANYRFINATSSAAGTCPYTGTPVTSTGCYPQGFGSVVNAGSYSQVFHALSIGAVYHFE